MQVLVTKSVARAHLPMPIKPADTRTPRLFIYLPTCFYFAYPQNLNHSLLLLSYLPRLAFRPYLSFPTQHF